MLAAMLAACAPGPNDTSEYRFIDGARWQYNDTLQFAPTIQDSVAEGMLTLSLRHTNEYLYRNLYVEVTIIDSLATHVDTLNIELADRYGRWHGHGIGTDYQLTDTIEPRIKLHRPVSIGVRHIMRTDRLDDIDRIGISFTETTD